MKKEGRREIYKRRDVPYAHVKEIKAVKNSRKERREETKEGTK
jgi:hypothetical protein